MREPNNSADPADEALMSAALLYAGGEMSGAEAAAFEVRLAEDQAAREALAAAAGLLGTLANGRPLRPDPAYRRRVAARLCPRPGAWAWLARPRLYRGHPAAWGLAGAAAAVLLMLAWTHAPWAAEGTVTAPGGPTLRHAEEPPAAIPAASADVASVWATLHTKDHLVRAHDEAARRRTRAEDRLHAARPDDHRPHNASDSERND